MTTRIATPDRRTPKGTAAGVLDTIADAVTLVLRRPWLMIVPLLVDVVLWLLLRVSMEPVINRLIELMETSPIEGYSDAADLIREARPEVMVSDYLGAFVPSLFAGMPIDTVMGGLMMLVAPDGFGILRADLYEPWRYGLVETINPDSVGTVGLVFLASILGSSLALVLFRVPLARHIRGTAPQPLVSEIGTSWVRFLLYILMVAVVMCVSIIPLMMLTALAALLGLGFGFIVMLALFIFGSMLGVYTFFAVDALLIHRTSPVNAFRTSYAVSRRYFPQVARFALTCIFVMLATGRLWSELSGNPVGLIFSLIGSAFIGTVLAAASMMFYTDRYRLYRAAESSTRVRPQAN